MAHKVLKGTETIFCFLAMATPFHPSMEAASLPLPFPALAIAISISIAIAIAVQRLLRASWLRPLQIRRCFHAQAIPCLPYRFLRGNLPDFIAFLHLARRAPMPLSHDILSRVLPHYACWSTQFGGSLFVHWFGYRARLNIADPDLVKEILINKSGHFFKLRLRPDATDLLGKGLIMLDGERWAVHRRIINPSFYAENLKAMNSTIAACASKLLDKWERQIAEAETQKMEIDVFEDFRDLTASTIAHTAFGSSSEQGQRVCWMQRQQQLLLDMLLRTIYIPGLRFVPTPTNLYRWRLEKEIRKSLKNIIQSRELSGPQEYGDLLGLMMASNRQESVRKRRQMVMDHEELIDECKNFFFAGHDTTLNLLSWTFMLLAHHKDWQDRTRAEVVAVCGKNPPSSDVLPHLKIVGMVLHEALRLYPPVATVIREASKDIRLSSLSIPEGAGVVLHVLALHHDPRLWGPDAHEFNPERFADGVTRACKHPMAFLPFSLGPRNCIGQNFALLEAKIVVSMILQRFRFCLSPGYKHAPLSAVTLQPEFGIPLIFEKAM